MTNRVRFVADMDDRTSSKLDRMRDKFDQLGSNKGAQAILQGVGISAGIGAMNALGSAVGVVTDKLVEGVKSAIEEEASIAKLTQALDTNVRGWQSHQGAIDAAISAGQRLAFTDDELRASLTSLSVRTKDVNRSLELQRTAMDLARLKGIDLATASELVGKVYGGNVGILARYGIAVEKGASATEALGQIQKQAAGQAEEFANTTAGAMAGANIAIDELFESIAAEAMPIIRELAFTVRDDVLPVMTDLIQAAKDAEPLWETLGDTISLVLEGPLGGGLDIAQRKIDELREAQQQALTDAATAWGQSADGVTEATREMNRGLVGTQRETQDLAEVTTTTVTRIKRDLDGLVDYYSGLATRLQQSGDAAAAAIYDPIIARGKLAATEREIAEQREIAASKESTRAQVEDAKLRIVELTQSKITLLAELQAHGELTRAEFLKINADLTAKLQGATSAQRAAIQILIQDLNQARLAALQAAGAMEAIGGGAGGGVGRGTGGRAHGGPVWPGVWTVGEDGPETLIMGANGSGYVLPSQGGGSGGNTVNITLNANGVNDPVQLLRMLRRELDRTGMTLA